MTEEPLYNIGIVTRITGVPIPTLHAWERRYGFPAASRSAGGHRLYSEKDIARLRWIKGQVDAGMAVSRAIAAARAMEADGRPYPPAALAGLVQPSQRPAAASLRENLVGSLLRHDLTGADSLLGEMLAFYSPEDLSLDVIGPALTQIGEAWEQGKLTVASEHLASNYLRHRLLMWMVTGPAPRSRKPIVLACGPEEWHEGSLLMLGVLLRRRGWPVAYLGQNVPFQDLAKFLQEIDPLAVVLVAMLRETALALNEWPAWIPQRDGKPAITFGGRGFLVHPELQAQVAGTYLGDTLPEGIARLEELLH